MKKKLSSLGEEIARQLDGRTLAWLSSRTHISAAAISNIMCGKNKANPVTLYAISTVLPVDYDTLVKLNG